MVRAALLCGTNKENLLLETGLDEGLLLSSDSQLWSIAGMLGGFYKGLFGLRVSPDSLEFRPCIPDSFAGVHELSGLQYRGMTVDARVSGQGRRIVRCRINGQDADPVLPAGGKGRIGVELELASDGENAGQVNLSHVKRSLASPEWKAGPPRHRLGRRGRSGLLPCIPERHSCIPDGILLLHCRPCGRGSALPGDGGCAGWAGILPE